MPQRQITECDITNPDTLEGNDLQADLFAHAANLAFAAFLQNELQLIGIQPADLGWAQLDVIQCEAVIE